VIATLILNALGCLSYFLGKNSSHKKRPTIKLTFFS
jgi:hypothetical protein